MVSLFNQCIHTESVALNHHLITSSECYLSRAEDIVKILKEGLIFDLIVSEDKADPIAFPTRHSVQVL